MKIIKIKLKSQNSALVTPLHSDIIFGHLCWQMAKILGEEKLIDFLNFFKNKKPIFLVSDGFFAGRLPKPQILIENYLVGLDANERLDILKKYKKVNELKIADFITFCQGKLDINIIKNILDKNYWKLDYKNEQITKNMIDRTSSQVKEGGLFNESYVWSREGYEFYLKIINDDLFAKFQIIELLKNLFENDGFGANKSSGCGFFRMEQEDFCSFDNLSNDGKLSILLSHAILAKEERDILTQSFYKIEVKYGKMGEEKAKSSNPFKQPLLQIAPGSVLANKKEWVGEMVCLSKENPDVTDYNYGFLLPIKYIES